MCGNITRQVAKGVVKKMKNMSINRIWNYIKENNTENLKLYYITLSRYG